MENAKLMSNLNLIEPKRSKSLLAIMFLLDLDQTLAWCVGRLILLLIELYAITFQTDWR